MNKETLLNILCNKIMESGNGYYEYIIHNFHEIPDSLGSLESVLLNVRLWFEFQTLSEIKDVGYLSLNNYDTNWAYSEEEEYAGLVFFSLTLLNKIHPVPWMIPTVTFYESLAEKGKTLQGKNLIGEIYLHSKVIVDYDCYVSTIGKPDFTFFKNLKQQ